MNKQIQSFICLFFLTGIFFSCKSTDEVIPAEVTLPTMVTSQQDNNKVLKTVKPEIIALLEKATPASLKECVSRIKIDSSVSSSEQNMVIYIARELMLILYPSEKITWIKPEIDKSNEYTNLIDSAKAGAYIFDHDTKDFLSYALPSLILLTTPYIDNFFDAAEEDLKKAISLNSESILPFYFLAILYSRKNESEEAFKYLEKAYEIEPSCYEISLMYANTLMEKNSNKEAYTIGKELLKNHKDIDVLKLCSKSSFHAGFIKDSDNYVAQVLQKEPNNTEFLLLRIKILVELNEYLKASSLLDVYSKTESSSKDYLVLKTKIQINWNKNTTLAVNTIKTAFETYPEDEEVLTLTCQLAFDTNKNISGFSAETLVNKILEKNENNKIALQIHARLLLKKEKYEEAYDIAFALSQEDDSIINSIIMVKACIGMKNYNEAVSFSKELFENNKDNYDIQELYIQTLIITQKTQEALQIIDELFENANETTKSMLYYERSIISTNSDSRIADLRASLQSNPRNEMALFDLYQVYYKKNEYRKAQYYLKQLISLDSTNESYQKLQQDLEKKL